MERARLRARRCRDRRAGVRGPLHVGTDRLAAAREILESAQAGNPEKLQAWEIVSSDRTATEKIAELAAVALPEAVRAAVLEQLAAVGAV
nr:hypothetical protein GCM10025730_49140 [Promicromonospora thailandica]